MQISEAVQALCGDLSMFPMCSVRVSSGRVHVRSYEGEAWSYSYCQFIKMVAAAVARIQKEEAWNYYKGTLEEAIHEAQLAASRLDRASSALERHHAD